MDTILGMNCARARPCLVFLPDFACMPSKGASQSLLLEHLMKCMFYTIELDLHSTDNRRIDELSSGGY